MPPLYLMKGKMQLTLDVLHKLRDKTLLFTHVSAPLPWSLLLPSFHPSILPSFPPLSDPVSSHNKPVATSLPVWPAVSQVIHHQRWRFIIAPTPRACQF